ncbi:MAG: DUF4382 domain-containing protein [Gammaproteobacteria bacterium]
MNFLKSFQLFFVFSLFIILSSCDGSVGNDSGGGSSAAGTGRVSLLITDGVTDKFDQVNLTVQSISFIRADDSGGDRESVVFDQPRVINLLALQNYSDLMVTTVIPAGIYNKIRLQVSQVELVKFSSDGGEPEKYIAKLPANGKVDLNPRGTFEVVNGGHLMIELDFDAEKSIHIIEKGSGKDQYNFRPVVFVTIVGADEKETKLVLMDGIVLARKGAGFKLCNPDKESDGHHDDDHEGDHDDDKYVSHEGDRGKKHDDDDDDEEHEDDDDKDHEGDHDKDKEHDGDYVSCLDVLISDITVVQNDLIEVVSASNVENGDIVTVLGKANSKNIDALHIVIEVHDKKVSDLGLFTGKATSVVDVENNFTMNTDGDNAVIQPLTALTVSLVDGSGVRVFDKNGTEVTADVIIVGTDVDVFGLAMPGINNVAKVKAAFVITDNAVKADKLSGTIVAVNEAEMQITVSVVNDVFSGDVCVAVNDAILLMLGIVDEKVVTEEITINKLQTEMPVDVYGQDDASSCMPADVVLVSEPPDVVVPVTSLLVTGK